MLGYHCPDCAALFDEMHSAVMEAKSIAQDARAQSRAVIGPENVLTSGGRLANGGRMPIKGGLQHRGSSKLTLRHIRSTPSSAKSMGQA